MPLVAWADPKAQRATELQNPGKYDQMNKEGQAILHLDSFDGLRMDLNKMASPTFLVGHHLTMGSSRAKESYAFSANFIPDNSNLIGGRIDPQGNLNARIIRQITDKLTAKIEAQVPPKPDPVGVQVEADYLGPTFSAGAKYSNEGFVSASFVQSITPNLTGAVESFHMQGRMSATHLAARYESPHFVGHMLWGDYGMLSMTYMRKASARVGLASCLQLNLTNGQTFVEGGYSFNLRQANVKARVDSRGTIGCVVEEKIVPGFTFLMSGEVDYSKQDYKFGFGVNIG
eukprot:c15180_g1_i1.p1 GENE.c15180_g1_i1~~c15180_g1_i1.p1  ORF type:complete len:314 (-),score=76.29 c15180_g1_i1:111-971(-)